MTFSLDENRIRANLAYQVYARRVDGRLDPDASYYDPEENRNLFPAELNDQYEITILYEEHGDFIYGFESRETEELYVVARGTDNFVEDMLQYPLIALGMPTPLGEQMAIQAKIFSRLNDGRPVHLVGHSLGGNAAEVAERLLPESLVAYVMNVQGPSVVETPFSFLFPNMAEAPDSPVHRLTSAKYAETGPGFTQWFLDQIGTLIYPPNDIPIPVREHDATAVQKYFENRTEFSRGSTLRRRSRREPKLAGSGEYTTIPFMNVDQRLEKIEDDLGDVCKTLGIGDAPSFTAIGGIMAGSVIDFISGSYSGYKHPLRAALIGLGNDVIGGWFDGEFFSSPNVSTRTAMGAWAARSGRGYHPSRAQRSQSLSINVSAANRYH